MKKHKEDHPEVLDIENICEITPNTLPTEGVCDKVNKHKAKQKRKSKSRTKQT
ncbi:MULTISPECIES: hypothetical protein [Legionella]|uniref:Uncharacterized protein n=1 Tax=Legionella drozanskii LLAP-1 TaxID=1212489 RepID=A0A0W0TBC9_9GAMM|nr:MULTISPECIES: hypothetical protein [Legionella]KTC92904.1 hypothetical protein Ldro_0275 [Legionella drozanskii LLAP-1]